MNKSARRRYPEDLKLQHRCEDSKWRTNNKF